MIGHMPHSHLPTKSTFNRWGFSVLISFVGHAVLVGAILIIDENNSSPIPAHIFNVEVVNDFTKKEQDEPETPKIKPSKTAPIQSNASSRRMMQPNLQSPLIKAVKPHTKKILSSRLTPLSDQNNFGPILNHIPKNSLPKKNKNLKKLEPTTTKINQTGKTKYLTQQQKAKELDVTPIMPRKVSNTHSAAKEKSISNLPVVPPRIDEMAQNSLPQYPRLARRRGLQGRLVLRVTVNSLGQPSVLKILKTSGHDLLDSAALKAVKSWHFQPGLQGKSPVKANIDLPVVFRLEGTR